MWWNEFPDPNFIFLHVLHIDIPQRTSELCRPQNSRWPPSAILDSELLSLFQNVQPRSNESLGSKVSNPITDFRGFLNGCHIPEATGLQCVCTSTYKPRDLRSVRNHASQVKVLYPPGPFIYNQNCSVNFVFQNRQTIMKTLFLQRILRADTYPVIVN